jgi:hypothetical protein
MERSSPRPFWLCFWAFALLATVASYLPIYRYCVEKPYRVGDFFQEWASAKNYLEGLPIYTPQEITVWRYLRQRPDTTKQVFVRMNGHPPPCVLLALPLARLDYAVALYLWTALTVAALLTAAALVVHFELGTCRTWLWLPLLTMLASNPFAQHMILGQLGAFLLLMIVGAVVADARERPVLAGLLVGTATALKLFPGLLLLYFLVHRRWRALAAALVGLGVWHGASIALFGVQTYRHFVVYAMPEVLLYRDWWANYSITGTWYKLFAPTSGQSTPLWFDPTTAKFGAGITTGLVVILAAYVIDRARRAGATRQAGLAVLVTAMVMTTPIAWDHYFLFLLWPLFRLAVRLPPHRALRVLLYGVLLCLWLNPLVLFALATGGARPPTAAEILLFVSWPFYAVVMVYSLGVRQALGDKAAATSPLVDSSTVGRIRSELRPVSSG